MSGQFFTAGLDRLEAAGRRFRLRALRIAATVILITFGVLMLIAFGDAVYLEGVH